MKEQFIHFTLNDFNMIVEKYGIDTVMSHMDENTFWRLHKYFGDYYDKPE